MLLYFTLLAFAIARCQRGGFAGNPERFLDIIEARQQTGKRPATEVTRTGAWAEEDL